MRKIQIKLVQKHFKLMLIITRNSKKNNQEDEKMELVQITISIQYQADN